MRGLTLLLPRLLRRCLVEHLLSLANDIRTKGVHVALPFAQQLLLLTSHAVGTDASWDSQHARSLVSALLPRPDLLQIAPTAASPQTEFAILALKIFTALLNPLPTSPTKPVPHSFRIELWHQLKSANLVDFLFSAAKVRNTTTHETAKRRVHHIYLPLLIVGVPRINQNQSALWFDATGRDINYAVWSTPSGSQQERQSPTYAVFF